MKIASHLEKIARLSDLRGRLDPFEDFELWFWSMMMGGTSAVNAALHHAGITPEEDAFPSQPGVYYVKSGQSDEFVPILKALGDVLHVGRPLIPGPIPPAIAEMMEAMEHLEHYRDPCTRGDMPIDAMVVKSCESDYAKCIRGLEAVLAEKRS